MNERNNKNKWDSILIKAYIYQWLLKRLIAKTCETGIPRSGRKGEAVNCYVVELECDESPYFMATSISEDTVTGLKWNGSSYTDPTTLTIAAFAAENLLITHYYGPSEVIYSGIYSAIWHYVTRLVYVKIKLNRYIESTFQYFFNKRKLVTKKRIELLQIMIGCQIDRTETAISRLELMEEIYSMRMFMHPSREIQEKKIQLYLDSLVASKDIIFHNSEYIVTGAALSTIERYEEDERRHASIVKFQRWIALITFIGVIFAVVQSGFIKLPTVIDLSKSDSSNSQ